MHKLFKAVSPLTLALGLLMACGVAHADKYAVQIQVNPTLVKVGANAPCEIWATGNPDNDFTVTLSNPDGRLNLSPTTITVPKGGTHKQFSIYGQTVSGTANDAVINAMRDLGGGQTQNEGSATATVYQLKILQDGADITDVTSPQAVNVGQLANLSVSVVPSTLTLSNYQWSILGNVVRDWTHDASGSFVWPIGNSQLTSSSLSFAWLDGGSSRQVSLTAQVNGVTASAKSTFSVTKPNYGLSLAPGAPVQILLNDPQSGLCLKCGDNNGVKYVDPTTGLGIPGITMTMTGVPNSDQAQCQFWQIVTGSTRQIHGVPSTAYPSGWRHVVYQYVNSAGNTVTTPAGDAYTLDTNDPYGKGRYTGTVTGNTYTYPDKTMDSPAQPMSQTDDQINVSDSFAHWLMYIPPGTEHTQSIWVPMSTATWSYSGAATKKGTTWATNDLTSSTNPQSATGNSTTSYPGGLGWTKNINGVTFIDGQN